MKIRGLTALVAAVSLGLGAGCAPTTGHARGVEAPEIDVVLFLVDTLRADRVGAYGYGSALTPNIDALARSGVVFEQAYAAGPWTLPSVTSLHTSTYMCEHGVLVDRQRVPEVLETLGERMRRAGYETASYFTNPYAGPMTGLDRGFDLHRRMHGTDATDVAPWLDEVEEVDGSAFLYVHNVEPHNPYDVPERYADRVSAPVDEMMREAVRSSYATLRHLGRIDWVNERPIGTTDTTILQRASLAFLDEIHDPVSEMYDAQVTHADERIGDLIAELKARGRWDRTLFVVVADHGEELGEHGGLEHGHTVYDELLRVPLMIAGPGVRPGRIEAPVSLLDLTPTLLDLVGVAAPDDLVGRSLRGALSGGALSAQPIGAGFVLYGEDAWAVVDGGQKWSVRGGAAQRFDLAADPGEQRPAAVSDPAPLIDALSRALSREVVPVWRITADPRRLRSLSLSGALSSVWIGLESPLMRPPSVQTAGSTTTITPAPRGLFPAEVFARPDVLTAPLTLTTDGEQRSIGADFGAVGTTLHREDRLTVGTTIAPVPVEAWVHTSDAAVHAHLQAMGYID